MNILGIETSCDETGAAVVTDGRTLRSSVVSTQIDLHKKYFGVVPEIASRAHVLTVNDVIDEAMTKARMSFHGKGPQIDMIGVTLGPGLVGALLVGKMTAQALGWLHDIPVLGVNHIEGHLLSPLLTEKRLKPPFLGLVVSGGHTELILASRWGDYRLLGSTRDDAAGEAFDKVAKMLNLGYPGGPLIDRLAKEGKGEKCPFPRPWLPGTWDFSFSGLKTAVLYKLREKKKWPLSAKKDLCAGFQDSVVDVLVGKTFAAAHKLGVSQIVVGGGVAANSQLRSQLMLKAEKTKKRLFMASPHLCTDNAAMIASAAYFKAKTSKPRPRPSELLLCPQLKIPPLGRTIAGFSPT